MSHERRSTVVGASFWMLRNQILLVVRRLQSGVQKGSTGCECPGKLPKSKIPTKGRLRLETGVLLVCARTGVSERSKEHV